MVSILYDGIFIFFSKRDRLGFGSAEEVRAIWRNAPISEATRGGGTDEGRVDPRGMLRGVNPEDDGSAVRGAGAGSGASPSRMAGTGGGGGGRGKALDDAPPGFASEPSASGRRGGSRGPAETLRLEEEEGPAGEVRRRAVYAEYGGEYDLGDLVKDDDDETEWEGDRDGAGAGGTWAGSGASPGTPATVSGTDLFNDDSSEAIGKLRVMFFSNGDTKGEGSLNEEAFVRLMGQERMQDLSPKERDLALRIVFAKIDSDMSGDVTWTEFLSFMLIERKSRIQPMAKIVRLLQQDGETIVQKRQKHAEMVTCVTCGSGAIYDFIVTASHDKTVMVWRIVKDDLGENQLELIHTIEVKEVVVGLVVTSDNALLICATTNDTLFAYELNQFKVKNYMLAATLGVRGLTPTWVVQEHPRGQRVPKKPTDIVYHFMMSTQRGELSRFIIKFDADYEGMKLRVSDPSVMDDLLPMHGVKGAVLQVHDGWINRFILCRDLGCAFSVGRDGQLAMTNLQTYTVTKRVTAHRGGANDVVYSELNMSLFTCGQDHDINIYHPLTLEFLQKLGSHKSPVLSLAMKEKDNHVISKNVSRELRLWELRTRGLIEQMNVTKTYYPENRITEMAYFPKFPPSSGGEGLFVTCARKPEMWKQVEMVDPRNVVIHQNPLLATFYMPYFKALLTVDESGIAMVWDLETGQVQSKYLCSHNTDVTTGVGSTLSQAMLGPSERRLFTGAEDGTIKVWNSSNGSCLAELAPAIPGFPVTGILYLNLKSGPHILSAGWNRSAALHQDPRGHKPRYPIEPVDVVPKLHETDIECMCALPGTDLVATGSADGKIKVWNVYSHSVHRVLVPNVSLRSQNESGLSRVTNINIECMCTARSSTVSITTLLSGGAHPQVFIWNTKSGRLAGTFTNGLESGTTVRMGIDRFNTLFVCGGSGGNVCVLDVSELGLSRTLDEGLLPLDCTPLVRQIAVWKAHDSSVSTAEFIQHGPTERCGAGGDHKRMPLFVVTSGTLDCNVFLWTIRGEMIGDFSSGNLYSLAFKGMVEYDPRRRYVGETVEVDPLLAEKVKEEEELVRQTSRMGVESDDEEQEEDLFFDARVFRTNLEKYKMFDISKRFSLAHAEARAAIVGRDQPYVQRLNPNLCGRFGERLKKAQPTVCNSEKGTNSGLGVKRPMSITGGMITPKVAPVSAPKLQFKEAKLAAWGDYSRLT